MGMSSPEWSRYMHDVIGLRESPEEINDEVVRRMLGRYEMHLPLIDGAVDAVRRLAGSFRLAVASSSNRPLIDAVLVKSGLAPLFEVTVSSEEVARGKPAPDVFLEAARRLERRRPSAAPRSRTRGTASAPHMRRACASSRSRTAATRRRRMRSRSPTSCSRRSRSSTRRSSNSEEAPGGASSQIRSSRRVRRDPACPSCRRSTPEMTSFASDRSQSTSLTTVELFRRRRCRSAAPSC